MVVYLGVGGGDRIERREENEKKMANFEFFITAVGTNFLFPYVNASVNNCST
jgi:hypothetical protein